MFAYCRMNLCLFHSFVVWVFRSGDRMGEHAGYI
jgi:hypothetical protein